MVRHEALRVDVVFVDADVRVAQIEDLEALRIWDADLDHEAAAWHEVAGGVLEARDLRILGGQVVDRVEDDVDERECSFDASRRHVADRYGDRR